ncbi:GYD domain-containing protein [Pseudoruegeria sp. HB172150]|uniref:GYD domain-containing protein n=1 Tax=Pseudoruegeria sp. HB172150 TaxID=2721164 RepID=UPI0015533025|nr:GYD domain-containing protein [Pseudoruegeria sp. HB172150]
MPRFITYASYSAEGMRGLLKKPEDRAAAIGALVEKSGGKLIALYMTSGSNDAVAITETPDGDAAAAVSMAIGASGILSRIETVRAWTSAEFVDVAKKAAGLSSAYTPPGA